MSCVFMIIQTEAHLNIHCPSCFLKQTGKNTTKGYYGR